MESNSMYPSEWDGSTEISGERAKSESSTGPSLTLPRLVSVKYIVAARIDELEGRVNAFLSDPSNYFYACIGPPDMFGHELFVQALQGYK
jgi:hypothetical protein